MRSVRLGKTGLMVSEVGFGGIPIQRLDDDEAVRLVRQCLDLGVTFIDTAHGYGTSEERIGRAIAGRHEGVVLASKSPARDAETFRQHLELSFQRLGVEHIHLYQFHNVASEQDLERVLAPGGPLEVLREAQASGRVGHIGVTSHSLPLSLKMAAMDCFETLMFPFNFVTDEAQEELIPLCRRNDVGFIVMKPMAGGLLERADAAFRFLRQFADTVSIPGIERAEEMREIVALMEGPAELSPEDRAEIARLREELGQRFCHRCDYCQPCPQEIPISMVLNVRSFWKRFPADRFVTFLAEGMARAEDCADCGECEERCPYELPIREMLREATAFYRERERALAAGGA